MVTHEVLRPQRVRAVSFPCGLARQFRVQFFASQTEGWQMYATYGRQDLAEKCLERLDGSGVTARLVTYRCCPTAG